MPAHKAPRGYVDIKEAAEIAGCSIELIRAAASRGELKGTQRVPLAPWDFKPEDVRAWRGIEESVAS